LIISYLLFKDLYIEESAKDFEPPDTASSCGLKNPSISRLMIADLLFDFRLAVLGLSDFSENQMKDKSQSRITKIMF